MRVHTSGFNLIDPFLILSSEIDYEMDAWMGKLWMNALILDGKDMDKCLNFEILVKMSLQSKFEINPCGKVES